MVVYRNEPILGPENMFVMDQATLNILTNEKELIAIDCLTIGQVIGNGYFGNVYEATLQMPVQDIFIDVAVKTLQSRCKLIYLIFKSYHDFNSMIPE